MHVIKQTLKIVLNHKYSIFALLFIQAHIFEENKKIYVCLNIITSQQNLDDDDEEAASND
jgi:hypothetical protein